MGEGVVRPARRAPRRGRSERALPPLRRRRKHAVPAPFKILQVPGLLVILYESRTIYRQIFLDGRPFPEDPQPAWNGYSVGKWEGETLVVESMGFTDQIWLDGAGHPVSRPAARDRAFPAAGIRQARGRDHDRRSEGLHEALDGDGDDALLAGHRADRAHLRREQQSAGAVADLRTLRYFSWPAALGNAGAG